MSDFPQDLFDIACKLAPNAYAPYSGFHVACVIRSQSGKLYHGVNVENASFALTSCAEKSAVSAMNTAGETSIAEVLVLGPGPRLCPPCGACRQILKEFAEKDTPITFAVPSGEYAQHTLGELLPGNFFGELLPCLSDKKDTPSEATA